MQINVSEKKIKSKIKKGDRIVAAENIKYPYFESEDKSEKKLCEKMNGFYKTVAEKYSYYVRNKLEKRIKLSRVTCTLPVTAGMEYKIAMMKDDVVSVVLDLVYKSGKNIKQRRFSQMWSVKRADIVPVSELVSINGKNRKKTLSLVSKIAGVNGENAAFGYFADYLLKLSKSFDIRNCFAVPGGLCFFVNAGIMSPAKFGSCNFVVPLESLGDVVKGEFLHKSAEKEDNKTNIVNNV